MKNEKKNYIALALEVDSAVCECVISTSESFFHGEDHVISRAVNSAVKYEV